MFKDTQVEDDYVPAPRLTTGDKYSGVQEYTGLGVVRWCTLCKIHKATLGGGIKMMWGGKHWVCNVHPKKPKVKRNEKA